MNDVFHDLIFMVATNMPDTLKSTLIPKLEMVYPNALKIVDTAEEGKENSFPAVHYSFWFKYGRRVCFFFLSFHVLRKNFRETVHPLMLILQHCKRMGSKGSIRLRMSQGQAWSSRKIPLNTKCLLRHWALCSNGSTALCVPLLLFLFFKANLFSVERTPSRQSCNTFLSGGSSSELRHISSLSLLQFCSQCQRFYTHSQGLG